MKRTTKLLGSTTGLMAAAAFTGLIAGASSHAAAATTSLKNLTAKVAVDGKAGAKAMDTPAATHDCKGKNDCKGAGGCSAGDGGCKGKNTCKGKGGCKTSGATTQPGLL